MYTIDQIKQYASTNTIFTEQHAEGIPGFIHCTGDSAIYCHPVEGGHVWTVNGERVRESEVRNMLLARQQ